MNDNTQIMRSFCINLRVLFIECCDLTQFLCRRSAVDDSCLFQYLVSHTCIYLTLQPSYIPALFSVSSSCVSLAGFNCRAVKPGGNSVKNPSICRFPPSLFLSLWKSFNLKWRVTPITPRFCSCL